MFRMLCLFLILAGTSLSAAEPPAEKKPLGFATPQEAWDAYRRAYHDGRWKDAFACMTPRTQQSAAIGFVFTAGYLGNTPEKDVARKLKAILKNYGLDMDQIEAEAKDVSKDKPADYMKELGRRLKDGEGLFHEAMTLLDPVLPQAKGAFGIRLMLRGKLTKVEIAADRATGKYMQRLSDQEEYRVGGVRQTELAADAVFRKINGRWFVDERAD